jgi:TP901 family phage tail tape measure protein
MSADDVAWVDVLPAMTGFAPALTKGLAGVGGRVGKMLGLEISGSMNAALAGAQAKTSAASRSLTQARNAEATAADRTRVAELKLNEVRAKESAAASQVAAAEARLAKAQRDQATAADSTVLASERLSAAQAEQGAAAASAGTLMSRASRGFLTAGTVLSVTAAVMGGKAVKSAADFQTQLTRLVTTAGESTRNIGMVSQGVLTLAGQTATSATELANGLYTIESAGFHGAAGLEVLRASAQGAKAENADLSTVTNAVTDLLIDFHKPATDAATVMSQMVEATSQGKVSFEDLAGSMSAIAPLASAAGTGIGDMLGTLAEMTSHGVSAEQATQNMAQAIRTLLNPSSSMRDELGQIGINASQLSDQLGDEGLTGTLDNIATHILMNMGPSGKLLLKTFNQSQIAAADANTMFKALPKSLQNVALEYERGQITSREWTLGLKNLSAPQASLLRQWATMQNKSKGFNSALRSGGTNAQSFSAALAKATGNSTTMNVALQVAGENYSATAKKIGLIDDATTEAGNNVKGWADIQNTFNFQIDKTKDSVNAAGIAIGQRLLPYATSAAKVFANVANWVSQNTGLFTNLLIAIGGLGGAFLIATLAVKTYTFAMRVVKAAQIVWIALTQGMTAAQEALNVAEDANPMVLIITGIIIAVAALAFGIVELVKHWSAVWGAIKGAASAVGHWFATVFVGFFVSAWHWIQGAFSAVVNFLKGWGGLVLLALGPIIAIPALIILHWSAVKNAFVVAFHAIAAAAVWFWNTVLHPIFNVLSIAFRLLVALIVTVVVTPIVIAVRALGAIFRWLYQVAIGPALRAIGAVAVWLWANVFRPVINALEVAWRAFYNAVLLPIGRAVVAVLRAIGTAASWLWANVFRPVINALEVAWRAFYNAVLLPIGRLVVAAIHAIGAAASWLWTVAIHPALLAIGNFFIWLWNHSIGWLVSKVKVGFQFWMTWMSDTRALLVRELKTVGGWFVWLWDHSIGWLIGKIDQGFSSAVKGIEAAWNKIKGIVAAPINFVVDWVYNKGIRFVWNHVIDAVGLHNLDLPAAAPIKFATGGVVPLAAGGVLPGYSAMDIVPAILRRGEGVLTPEAVSLLGGPGFVHGANRAARGPGGASSMAGGVGRFAGGGIIGQVLSAAGNVAKGVVNLFTHPVATVESMLPNDARGVVNMVAHIPGALISKAAGFLVKQLTNLQAPHDPGAPGKITAQAAALLNQAIALTGVTPHDAWFNGMNTLIWRESGWNPRAVNRTDINAKLGHPSEGLAQVIAPTFGAYRLRSLPDDPFNPLANIVSAIRYILVRYHSIGNVQQANPNLPPKGYSKGGVAGGIVTRDHGGPIAPGITAVNNQTGKVETMLPFTPGELASIVGGNAGPDEFELIEGTMRIADDGLNAMVSGKLRKTGRSAATRVRQGFRY